MSDDCNLPPRKVVRVIIPKNKAEARKLRLLIRDYDLIVGIDPGVDTGFAEWDKRYKKLLLVETYKIHQALDRARKWSQLVNLDRVLVRVEDARLRKWLPKEKSNVEYRGRLQGAGSVKRDSKIWEDFLTELGVDFEMLGPRPGLTKWSEAYFKQVTGWTGKTDNHGRDAAANIYGL